MGILQNPGLRQEDPALPVRRPLAVFRLINPVRLILARFQPHTVSQNPMGQHTQNRDLLKLDTLHMKIMPFCPAPMPRPAAAEAE